MVWPNVINASVQVELWLAQGHALYMRGMSLLSAEMPWLAPYLHALNSVFIEGDAAPEVSVQVMAGCAAVLFLLVNTPKARVSVRVAERGQMNRLSQA